MLEATTNFMQKFPLVCNIHLGLWCGTSTWNCLNLIWSNQNFPLYMALELEWDWSVDEWIESFSNCFFIRQCLLIFCWTTKWLEFHRNNRYIITSTIIVCTYAKLNVSISIYMCVAVWLCSCVSVCGQAIIFLDSYFEISFSADNQLFVLSP